MLSGISAGADGVPIAVGASQCMSVCNGGFQQPLSESAAGTKWATLKAVYPGGGKAHFTAVSALSAKDAWAVGEFQNSSSLTGGLVERWDGKAWTMVPSRVGQGVSLFAVTASSDSDVWAAGSGSDGELVEHWDGSQWTQPGSASPSQAVQSMTAISGSDVWAVGLDDSTYAASAEHWNGTSWETLTVPVPSGAVASFLLGVSGTGSSDVWAAGTYLTSDGVAHGLIEHWDGSGWSIVPSVARENCGPVAISSLATVDVWASGVCITSGGSRTFVEHWNGTKWKRIPSPNAKGEPRSQFWGVTAIAVDDVWAVGGSDDEGLENGSVLVAHWNGSKWKLVKALNPRPQVAPASYAAPTAQQQTRLAPAAGAESPNAAPQKGVCFSNLDGDNSTFGVNSQTYEDDYAAYDDQAAADATLTSPCKVRSVTVMGTAACGAIQSETVTFYSDKDGHPGKKIRSQTAEGDVTEGRCGSLDIAIKPLLLQPGTYWVSVVANLAFMTGGRWSWDETTDQSGADDVWRENGSAYGLCGRWQSAQTCTLADDADLTLQLSSSKAS